MSLEDVKSFHYSHNTDEVLLHEYMDYINSKKDFDEDKLLEKEKKTPKEIYDINASEKADEGMLKLIRELEPELKDIQNSRMIGLITLSHNKEIALIVLKMLMEFDAREDKKGQCKYMFPLILEMLKNRTIKHSHCLLTRKILERKGIFK